MANLILPGKGIKQGPFVSEQELLAMADVAAPRTVIEREERTLIHSIIDFGDTVVREVMVPRPDMVAVEATETGRRRGRASPSRPASAASRCTRTGIDDIVGIVYIKDLMRAEREGRGDEPVRDDHAGGPLRARDQAGRRS